MSIINIFTDFAFRVFRILGREIIAHSKNKRPASYPFISGDGFRQLAQHVFDNLSTLKPESVKDGDIVFVGDSKIDKFIEEIHKKINCQYILITHNGDATVNEERFLKVESKIIAWYGINVLFSHKKIIPIPLGIENKYIYVCGIPAVFNWVINLHRRKKDKIFYGFSISTNLQERQKAFAIISKHPEAETLKSWRGFFSYLKTLSTYKMVVSPPGSSTEGHRTWDTLYVGGVPIVMSSVTTDYFKSIDVPLLVLSDWSELESLNKDNIGSTFSQIIAEGNKKTLYFDYWKRLITEHE